MTHSPPSVLHVTTGFPRFKNDFPGSFVFRFARYWGDLGGRVGVIAPGAPGAPEREVMEGIEVYRATYFRPSSRQRLCYDGGGILANLRNSWLARLQVPFLFWALAREVRRRAWDYDLIHCHWLPTVWAAWAAQRFVREPRPIVFTNWGSDTRLLPGWLIRLSLKAVTACASSAEETDQHLLTNGYTKFAKIRTPVDEDRFNEGVPRDVFPRAEGIPADRPLLSFVGRLNYFKDPLTFIDACAHLHRRGVSFVGVLAGDGDLMPQCRQRITALELEDAVRLVGSRTDVEYIFAASAVTVHISPVENTWANTITEAMQCGCPVILSDAGYTRKTFTHGTNCYLVPARDPVALADAFDQLLGDPALRTTLVQGGRRLLKEAGKDSGSVKAKLLAFYQDAMGGDPEAA